MPTQVIWSRNREGALSEPRAADGQPEPSHQTAAATALRRHVADSPDRKAARPGSTVTSSGVLPTKEC